ncbi:MAG: hypothetical protein IJZ25_04935 [Lachnospiraceae bacterium]|nr:hypothetical protein [Lachnospiraceae bacterium]
MKYFQLTDTGFRKSVNLKLFEEDIASAVAKVKPDAQLFVKRDYFYTIPDLGKRESILVSQELRQKSSLNDYTLERPCLFSSTQRLTKKQQMEEN